MTKTEQKIMNEIQKNGYCSIQTILFNNGSVSGNRTVSVMRTLKKKGLITITHTNHEKHYDSKGNTKIYTNYIVK